MMSIGNIAASHMLVCTHTSMYCIPTDEDHVQTHTHAVFKHTKQQFALNVDYTAVLISSHKSGRALYM